MNYNKIIYEDTEHGDGIRCTLLVQGANKDSKHIANEFKDPEAGKKFTEVERDDIVDYLINTKYIQGLSIAGGDPLYDTNVDDIYELVKAVRDKCDNIDIWLFTEYDWADFKYWEHIMNVGFLLGDKYKTRLEIVKMVDVIHCKNVYEKTDFSYINVKESRDKKEIILHQK